ncbi:hypothetical protein RB195_021982 [Necator americanus]|uniref:Uncharacterized protein n=1 Tax=Necator americanus TaxID=51031 RepID=A0ABR1EG74_NECAM
MKFRKVRNSDNTFCEEPPSTSNKRQISTRASETRAYDIIKEFEEGLDNTQSPVSVSSNVVMVLSFLCLISPNLATKALTPLTNVLCKKGVVRIIPLGQPFELCFNNECKIFSDHNKNLRARIHCWPAGAIATVAVIVYLCDGAKELYDSFFMHC